MKELKDRLKTVQELLNLAEFIRTKSGTTQAAEANNWELKLQERKGELVEEIEAAKLKELAHA